MNNENLFLIKNKRLNGTKETYDIAVVFQTSVLSNIDWKRKG
ncbi:hypothetical protein SAMN04488577_0798 [Bacillus sp. cl95]|nr:hypothetical protein SAMN02799634_101523 [Bacillus sp. UNCCL13]SFQ65608.1 hypothetical protein SAMN04488577_0798 [Bacillus sp. cl95]